ncbi:LamG-like jellyroll fold domain-containing protein [Candidatus Venteria ishoeyi]|uniref:LamG-like jellyroll fold domain-containing protein n=1 Tax=Candidatus Venteria ishoeyi TaxID=1899563 RepID=UPI0015AD5111|nr:LamG-like jellyroll fold domain-containing protein [Candidatus Venteria ishoeyi]
MYIPVNNSLEDYSGLEHIGIGIPIFSLGKNDEAKGALNFNSNNSNILSFSDKGDFIATEQLSISLWFKALGDGTLVQQGSTCPTTGMNSSFRVSIENGYIYAKGNFDDLTTGVDASHHISKSENPIALDGSWHHLAVNFDAGEITIYLDSNQVSTSTSKYANGQSSSSPSQIMINSLAPVYLGAGHSYCNNSVGNIDLFNGAIDELRVYKRVLSTSELIELASNTMPNAITIMKFSGNILDSSLSGNDASGTPVFLENRFNNSMCSVSFSDNTIDNVLQISDNTDYERNNSFSMTFYFRASSNGTLIQQGSTCPTTGMNSSFRVSIENGYIYAKGNFDDQDPNIDASHHISKSENPIVLDGSWHHLAVNFDAGEITIYLDSNQVSTSTSKYTNGQSSSSPSQIMINSLAPIYLGAGHSYCNNSVGNVNLFSGAIDDLYIYTSTLTISQIELNSNLPNRCEIENPTTRFTSITPLNAILNQLTTFTVFGENMTDTTAFWIGDCEGMVALSGGTATERRFQCTPQHTTGIKDGTVKNESGGSIQFPFSVAIDSQPSTVSFTSVTPLNAILNQLTTFTVFGENMTDTTAFWIGDCEGMVALSGGTATERRFQCTPQHTTGIKDGIVKNESGGSIQFPFSISIATNQSYSKPLSTYPDRGGFIGFGHITNRSYHVGSDYRSTVGTEVYAICAGTVFKANTDFSGFGGYNPTLSGGAIIINHSCGNRNFYAIYGHLNPSVNIGDTIQGGQMIGTITDYIDAGRHWPHLHLGIYTGNTFPSSGWGYSDNVSNWHDPEIFLPFMDSGMPGVSIGDNSIGKENQCAVVDLETFEIQLPCVQIHTSTYALNLKFIPNDPPYTFGINTSSLELLSETQSFPEYCSYFPFNQREQLHINCLKTIPNNGQVFWADLDVIHGDDIQLKLLDLGIKY